MQLMDVPNELLMMILTEVLEHNCEREDWASSMVNLRLINRKSSLPPHCLRLCC